ncbi:MAG TPA: transcription antitermination factor NusB [Alphaproteobacteria bacterium]|nr:transcription antitermination factor NusB [Alphaproteobacteria bacterium]
MVKKKEDAPAPAPEKAKTRPRGSAKARRRSARLAAVQALYQVDLTGTDPEVVMGEFITYRFEEDIDGDKLISADIPTFIGIVRGVTERRGQIDEMIAGSLSGAWTVDRLEVPLRAVLRAGIYELLAEPEVATGIIIDEYVEITHAFFANREPGMVNAVLDRIGKAVRGPAA